MNREKISKQIASNDYNNNLYGLMNLLKLEIKNIDDMLYIFNDEDFKKKNINKFLITKQRDIMRKCLWEIESRMKSEGILNSEDVNFDSIPVYANTSSSIDICKYLINIASKKKISISKLDIQGITYLMQLYGAYYNERIFADDFVAMDIGICMPNVYFEWSAFPGNFPSCLNYSKIETPLCASLIEAVLDFYNESKVGTKIYGIYEEVVRNYIWRNKQRIHKKKMKEMGFNKFNYEPITWEEIRQNAKEHPSWINSINLLIKENKQLEQR